jgi:acetyl-CoA acetyltransferase
MNGEVAIIGIGIHRFGRTEGVSGREQGAAAVRAALADAGIGWAEVQFAVGGSAASGYADTLVNELGLTGPAFVNVINGCATGGSALMMGSAMIASGQARYAVVVGFDKHEPGAFNPPASVVGLDAWYAQTGMMVGPQFFGMKIQRYLYDHDIDRSVLAKVSAKAFRNGARNPHAWRRTELSEEQINAAPMLADPLTKYMLCSPSEGAVAFVLTDRKTAAARCAHPVIIAALTQRTRRFGSFEVFSPWLAAQRAPSPTFDAAQACFEAAGIGPDEVDIAQIQDTDAGAEIMHMAETGLCSDGEQEKLIATGATEIDGFLPINTDGGCLASGEPIGATGLRQVYENVLQLRGHAGDRQVPAHPKIAFTHVYGAPGVSACTLLTKPKT